MSSISNRLLNKFKYQITICFLLSYWIALLLNLQPPCKCLNDTDYKQIVKTFKSKHIQAISALQVLLSCSDLSCGTVENNNPVFSAYVSLFAPSMGSLSGTVPSWVCGWTGQEDLREGIRTRTGQVCIQCMVDPYPKWRRTSVDEKFAVPRSQCWNHYSHQANSECESRRGSDESGVSF